MPQKFTASQFALLNTRYAALGAGKIPGSYLVDDSVLGSKLSANSVDATRLAVAVNSDIAKGVEAHSWGNHADFDYLTTALFNASIAASITAVNIANWNTAYGWGNHASAGYVTVHTRMQREADTVPALSTSITLAGNPNSPTNMLVFLNTAFLLGGSYSYNAGTHVLDVPTAIPGDVITAFYSEEY